MNSPSSLLLQKNTTNPVALDTYCLPPAILGPTLLRPRLLTTLCHPHVSRTLLRAPLGFGKTTLLAQAYQHLQQQGLEVYWLTLDCQDNDVCQFLKKLSRVLKHVRQQWPEFQPESCVALEPLAIELGAELNRLHGATLFIDNAECLTDPMARGLLHALLLQKNRLRMVTASTSPASWDCIHCAQDIAILDASKLAFSEAEVSAFLALYPDLSGEQTHLRSFYQMTAGWPSGLATLASSILLNESKDDLSALQETIRITQQYLLEHLSKRLPKPYFSQLIHASFLTACTAPALHEIFEHNDSHTFIDYLKRHQLFLLADGHDLRFIPLIREALMLEFCRRETSKLSHWHNRASHYYATQNQWQLALRHALIAPELFKEQDLSQWARQLAQHGQINHLLAGLSQLPASLLSQSLQLQITLAWALAHHFCFEPCRRLLSQAQTLAARFHPSDSLFHQEIRAVSALCAALADDSEQTEHLLTPLQTCLADLPKWLADLVKQGLSTCYFIQGRHHEAIALHQNLHPVLSTRQCSLGPYQATILGQIYVRQADLARANHVLQEALNSLHSASGKLLLKAPLAELYYETGQWRELSERIEPKLAALETCATLDALLAVYRSLIRMHHSQGSARAHSLINQGLTLAANRNWPRFAVAMHSEQIRLMISEDTSKNCREQLAKLSLIAEQNPDLAPASAREINELLHFHEARLALNEGNYRYAKSLFAELGHALKERGRLLAWIQLETLNMCCQWQLGCKTAALAGLKPLLTWGAAQNLQQSFVDTSPILPALLQAFASTQAAQGALAEYVKRLTKRFPSTITPSATQTVHLSGRELELLHLVAQGSSNKAMAKTLNISSETVKWHLKNIYTKLGVSNRVQALTQARALCLGQLLDA